MAKIQFVAHSDRAFESVVGSDIPADVIAIRKIFGDAEQLELFEVRMAPGIATEQHAHVEDEVVLVVEGSVVFGNRTLEAGSAVLVPAWTLYQFKAGPSGVRFANFRVKASDRRIITKDEFLAERKLHSAAAGEPAPLSSPDA